MRVLRGFLHCLKGLYCAIRSSPICSGAIPCAAQLSGPHTLHDWTVSPDDREWLGLLSHIERVTQNLAAVLTLQCIEQCRRKLVKMMNSQVSVSIELY